MHNLCGVCVTVLLCAGQVATSRTATQESQIGESAATEGLDEGSVHIGDVFQLGSAQLVVTEPRMPCFKLTIRFNRENL